MSPGNVIWRWQFLPTLYLIHAGTMCKMLVPLDDHHARCRHKKHKMQAAFYKMLPLWLNGEGTEPVEQGKGEKGNKKKI